MRLRALIGLAIVLSTWAFAQDSPLPDSAAFLVEVRKRIASNDLIQSHFSYRERATELRLNPFGRMGTGPVLVHEVYPHPNDDLTYRRLVERDGHELPLADLADQDRRYRERLTQWQRQIAREGRSEREARQRKDAEARAKDQAQANEALDLFTFTLDGRETWEGQPAITITFVPKPDAHPRTREGRVAAAFAGKAWVHEYEYQVMRVEAKAVDDVMFGFGVVARLNKGSTAVFTRRRIGDAWLPVETRFNGAGRALLFRKVQIDFTRAYYAYRPFDPSELPSRLGWTR
jgi:hypothetical protein